MTIYQMHRRFFTHPNQFRRKDIGWEPASRQARVLDQTSAAA